MLSRQLEIQNFTNKDRFRDNIQYSFSNENVDDILLYFIDCELVKPFVEIVFNWWFNISEIVFQLD